MNLALGLEAANAYFKEDDRRIQREREGKRFGWEEQRAQSEMSLLPDKTEATRSGYRDQTAANAARAQTRPGETTNTLSRQKNEAAELDYTGRTQPEQFAQRDRERELKAGETSAAILRQPDELATTASNARVGAAVARQKEEMIPDMLREMSAKNAISAAEQSDAVLGVLARRINSNDVQGALAFANRVAAIPGLLPNTDGKRFVNITAAESGTDAAGGSGPGYIFETDDGQKVFTSHQTMQAAYRRSLGNPMFKFLQDWRSGAVYAGDERTGRITAAVAPDAQRLERTTAPGTGRGGGRSGEPADVKKAKWLIESGVARDENEAWQMVTTAKQKSKAAFIQEYVTKNSGIGSSPEDLAQQANQAYEAIRTMSSPPARPAAPAGAPSNSGSAGTVPGTVISPEMKRLLGIK